MNYPWKFQAHWIIIRARYNNKSEIDQFPIGGNNSCLETVAIINCALNGLLMPICIAGNTLLLPAIMRFPLLYSPSTVFFCSLVVSDLLVGLVTQPFHISNQLSNNLLLDIMNITVFSACAVSLSTVTAISVDRVLALHYHMRYPDLMTMQRAIYTSASLWLSNSLLSLSILNRNAFIFTVAIIIVTCLTFSTVCYITIFRILRQLQLQIHAQQQAVENLNTESNQNMQRSKKSAINTFIYYIAMFYCYTPLFIVMITLSISHLQLRKR